MNEQSPRQGAPLPEREEERLEDVLSLRVLDSPPSERLERLTELARSVFDVPVALVSLVDRERQWFLCNLGYGETRETDRRLSFCAHAIHEDELLEVPDTRQDPRFRDNPLVHDDTRPIVFYIGAVLFGVRGFPVGTLCLIDHRPRRFSDPDKERLLLLARMVEEELWLHHGLERERRRVRDAVFLDSLTRLPNRRRLEERLGQELARNPERLRIVYIRLRRHDDLMSALGPGVADDAIRAIANRLMTVLPETWVLGRWDDERFLVFNPDPGEDPDAQESAWLNALRSVLAEPLDLGGLQHPLQLAVGFAGAPVDGRDPGLLVTRARTAARIAARQAEDEPVIVREYSSDLRRRQSVRFDLETRLRQSLEQGELVLEYQPKLAVDSGLITGSEALLRWDNPELGRVSPGDFIPIAEESGLIRPIGGWVIEAALRQQADWQQRLGLQLPVAVNVAGEQFRDPRFASNLEDALRRHGLAADCVEIEVTERTLVSDLERVRAQMAACAEIGVRLSVDDFGTGYSSLAYLQRFPLTSLKVDRTFIASVDDGSDQGDVLARTILGMARNLGLNAVAEGVETREQLEFLHRQDCPEYQGFLTARPMSAGDFADFWQSSGSGDPVRAGSRAPGR